MLVEHGRDRVGILQPHLDHEQERVLKPTHDTKDAGCGQVRPQHAEPPRVGRHVVEDVVRHGLPHRLIDQWPTRERREHLKAQCAGVHGFCERVRSPVHLWFTPSDSGRAPASIPRMH